MHQAIVGNVQSGNTQSCGCYDRDTSSAAAITHGKTYDPVYRVYHAMLDRCYNPNCRGYRWYGAKGIKVDERWHTFENFYADMGDPPPGHDIHRKDSNKNYFLDNCLWLTEQEHIQIHIALRRKLKE